MSKFALLSNNASCGKLCFHLREPKLRELDVANWSLHGTIRVGNWLCHETSANSKLNFRKQEANICVTAIRYQA